MKALVKIGFWAFALIVLTVSCKKEQPLPDIYSDDSSDEGFVVGNGSDNLAVHTLEPAVVISSVFGQYYVNYTLDIDNNGNGDFEFDSYLEVSPGGTNSCGSSVKILNNSIDISVIDMTDVTYCCLNEIHDTVKSIVYYNDNSTYQCPAGNIDSLLSISTSSYPKIYKAGDSLTSSASWSHDALVLSYCNASNYIFFHPPESYKIVLGNWNNSGIKYIVFRMTKGNRHYYGWLRISVNEFREILLYEYAFRV